MKIEHREYPSRPAPLWLKYTAIGVGILMLLWLPLEDSSESPVMVFALIISGVLALRVTYLEQNTPNLLRIALIGLLAGLFVIPIALVLIAFKTGVHSHDVPDFPAEQILSILQRIPLFTLGGLFLGVGSGVWLTAKKPKPPDY